MEGLEQRRVGFVRFESAVNLGADMGEVRLLALALCPARGKEAKSALETGRSFASLLARPATRLQLSQADTAADFKAVLKRGALEAAQSEPELAKTEEEEDSVSSNNDLVD